MTLALALRQWSRLALLLRGGSGACPALMSESRLLLPLPLLLLWPE